MTPERLKQLQERVAKPSPDLVPVTLLREAVTEIERLTEMVDVLGDELDCRGEWDGIDMQIPDGL